MTRPASSSSPSSEGNDGHEEQNAELILLQTKVEELTKELASTRAISKSSNEEAQAKIDEYETLIDRLTKRLLKRSKQMRNLKLENAELESQILPVKILPAELPVSLCPYVLSVDLLLHCLLSCQTHNCPPSPFPNKQTETFGKCVFMSCDL